MWTKRRVSILRQTGSNPQQDPSQDRLHCIAPAVSRDMAGVLFWQELETVYQSLGLAYPLKADRGI